MDEAIGFAIIVLRKLSAADREGNARRAAEGRDTCASDAGRGGCAGNGVKG
ncbi:hypothetical protein [Aureimonas psammosilenae]|uniref:hypothetical protein n=1 Tax=Aureimonas psammosilenae TaxID=2495496 RepID=UPI00186A2292|nr:hypothetical protein [Aureimonas psammosilenae]